MRISDWSSDVCSSDLFLAQPPICAKRADRRKAAAAQAIRHQRGGHAKPHGALAIKSSVDIENHQPDGRPVDSQHQQTKSEESRVGKECVSQGRDWWSPEP